MYDFYEELSEGEFFLRDKHQFELKTEYSFLSSTKKNQYTLDFYFFIPDALQINSNTYSKQQFYQDLTSLIRFKTPDLSFKELVDFANPASPLTRIKTLVAEGKSSEEALQNELKLLGNIVRSWARKEIKEAIEHLASREDGAIKQVDADVSRLCQEVKAFREKFFEMEEFLLEKSVSPLFTQYWCYLDEFLSVTLADFFTGLLKEIRKQPLQGEMYCEARVLERIAFESQYREQKEYRPAAHSADERKQGEFLIYRKGLLKKFVLDVLLLSIQRKESKVQYSHLSHLVAAFAAGVAMLIYVLVFVFQTNNLIINSTPFILGTVFLYVLKDRLKEEIRVLLGRVFKRLPDYTTMIKTPDEAKTIGKVGESFKFLLPREIPEEIMVVRNRGFHQELVEAKRIENVFRYRKKVTVKTQFFDEAGREYDLNNIFRFNIKNFLAKASDAYVDEYALDSASGQLTKVRFHKIYHINIIIKNTYSNQLGKRCTELKKIRLILDKDGLDRIEKIP